MAEQLTKRKMINFKMKDITKITGIQRGRMEQWLDKGFVRPSINRAFGQGSRNIFSHYDLYEIALFIYLINFIKRKKAARLVTLFRDNYPDDISVFPRYIYFFEKLDGTIKCHFSDSYDLKIISNIAIGFRHMLAVNFDIVRKKIDSKVKQEKP